MTKYVAGFLFDTTLELVVLIEKLSPEWQAGTYNAVGGKIEEGETPIQAMSREFIEEAGMKIDDWKNYCVLTGNDYEVYFFHSVIDTKEIMNVRSMTKEHLGVLSLSNVSLWSFPLLPSVRWLLPMALTNIKDGNKNFYSLLETTGK